MKLIKSLKFEAPPNRIIGFLLRLNYLEKDPNNPEDQSRLSPKSANKMGVQKQAEDARLALLRNLKNELNDILKEIEPYKERLSGLEQDINDLLQQVHEKQEAQKKINETIEELEKKITPAHRFANERIPQIEELLNSPLA
jgi:predicted  nucleic acid-binding Zn-ribbon protein